MEKKKSAVAEIFFALAAIALSFAAVLASEYWYGNISIGLAVALGICLISVIFNAACLGKWREKIQERMKRPEECRTCGGTEFRSKQILGQTVWECKNCDGVMAFQEAAGNQ